MYAPTSKLELIANAPIPYFGGRFLVHLCNECECRRRYDNPGMCITSKHGVYPRFTCMLHNIHPPLTCFRAQIHPQTFHSTRLPSRRPSQTCNHHYNRSTKTHYSAQQLAKTHKPHIHNVRSNSPHHRSLPRAILPPDRPHSRQSPPVARRAGDYRRRRPDQCFFEPRKLCCWSFLGSNSASVKRKKQDQIRKGSLWLRNEC